ncbi:MAG: hypothetical protein ACKVQR_08285 [Aquabacterium sp.]
MRSRHDTRSRLLALAAPLLLSGCAVVSVAGAVAGAAVSVGGAVVSSTVTVGGKVVGAAVDVVTSDKDTKKDKGD